MNEVLPSSGPDRDAALRDVSIPAICLLIYHSLGALFQVMSFGLHALGVSLAGMSQLKTPGADAFPALAGTAVMAATSGIGLVLYGLGIFGAIKLKKLESYGLAMTSAILAMLPCTSCCCVIGLGFGIWTLIVLNKPNVKQAFH